MKWEKFIVGKEISLLKFFEGLDLESQSVYTREFSCAEKAGSWDPECFITFVTEVKE